MAAKDKLDVMLKGLNDTIQGKVFGTQLKKLREHLELTQEEFADKVNLGRTTICAYEKGSRVPALSAVTEIIKATNCSFYYLIGMQPNIYDAPSDNSLHSEVFNSLSDTSIQCLQDNSEYIEYINYMLSSDVFWDALGYLKGTVEVGLSPREDVNSWAMKMRDEAVSRMKDLFDQICIVHGLREDQLKPFTADDYIAMLKKRGLYDQSIKAMEEKTADESSESTDTQDPLEQ